MEKFKAVEKEMKTKAYSKEGLLNAAKLDPKERQKQEMVNFLSDCTADLDRQIEACEAESESLAATMKRGKKDTTKADRIGELEKLVERHKWHQAKLELIMRLLENGQRDVEQVERIKDDIKWYIDSNQDVDFDENNDDIYEELDLGEEEELEMFGLNNDAERLSSQDTTSVADEPPEKPAAAAGVTRRPSSQMKSPLAPHAGLHQTGVSSNALSSNGTALKPAPPPARPAGELKYASVATAAAAADKSVGLAPLPPPPGAAPVTLAPLPPPNAPKQPTRQPSSSSVGPAVPPTAPTPLEKAPTPAPPPAALSPNPVPTSPQEAPASEITAETSVSSEPDESSPASPSPEPPTESLSNGTNGVNGTHEPSEAEGSAQDDCIYHLPPGLQDMMSSFEATKNKLLPTERMLNDALEVSYLNAPDTIDAEKPKHYKPAQKYHTPSHYPQEPLPIFDDPALYKRVDTDTLFYVFYYRQGTYQQYLAAKELKRQSWRFHKQYQTWFQRHEEPKTITEEYEQGTYRFFDYESTW